MVPSHTAQFLRSGRVYEELSINVAQKSMEVHLGTLSKQLQCSKEQAGRLRSLPVLNSPSQGSPSHCCSTG